MEHGIFKCNELKSGIFQIEEYGVFAYLIVGDTAALLIDTGTGFGDLAEFVRGITDKPLTVAATHAHPDHIGGRGAFRELYLPKKEHGLARFYGTTAMRRLMFGKKAQQLYGKKRSDIKRGLYRTKYFPLTDGHVFSLGGKTVRCVQIPGHTKGGMMFLLCEDKLIFTGDNLCRALWMFLPGSTTVQQWITGAEKAYEYLSDYRAYSAHDSDAQDPELIAKLIATAKSLVSERKNTFFPKIKVYPADYTDHGIIYRTTRVTARRKRN